MGVDGSKLDRRPRNRHHGAMERVVRKFSSFGEAEDAEVRFLHSLSSDQRLRMLLQIIRAHQRDDEQGFKRVYRIVKLPRR